MPKLLMACILVTDSPFYVLSLAWDPLKDDRGTRLRARSGSIVTTGEAMDIWNLGLLPR